MQNPLKGEIELISHFHLKHIDTIKGVAISATELQDNQTRDYYYMKSLIRMQVNSVILPYISNPEASFVHVQSGTSTCLTCTDKYNNQKRK